MKREVAEMTRSLSAATLLGEKASRERRMVGARENMARRRLVVRGYSKRQNRSARAFGWKKNKEE